MSNPVSEGTAAAFQVTLGEAAGAELNVSVSVTESGSMLSGTPPASVAFAEGESTTLTVAISNGVTFGADQAVALALSRDLYIEQMFTNADTFDFVGSVRGTAPEERAFTGVAVELDASNQIFTTLPVVPVTERMDRE